LARPSGGDMVVETEAGGHGRVEEWCAAWPLADVGQTRRWPGCGARCRGGGGSGWGGVGWREPGIGKSTLIDFGLGERSRAVRVFRGGR
jgi:hypothetical protein